MTLIKREDALKPFCTAPDGTRIPEVDCDNFPVAFSVEFIKKHLLSLPSVEPHNKDAISREGLLKSWEELSPRGRLEFDQVIMTIPALPSAEAVEGEKNEILKAIYTINNFLDTQGEFLATSMWRAKDGTTLKCDWGYFDDGMRAIEKYLKGDAT